MPIYLWLLPGLLLGIILIFLARRSARGERRFLAMGLVVAAILYIGFAAVGDANVRWLLRETLGAVFYGALAWLGLRYSVWWLVLGWATHPAWDIFLHLTGDGSTFTPPWYAVGCVSLDLLVAAYLAAQTLRQTNPGTDKWR